MKRNIFLGVFVAIAIVAASFMVGSVSAQKRVSKRSEVQQTAEPEAPQATVAGHPIRVDDFNYPVGPLTMVGGASPNTAGWVSNTGTLKLQVSGGSLSYAGYPSSGIGNKLDLVSTATSAEDTYRNFPTQTSGTTYAAFLVNVTDTTGLSANASTTGDYFAGFISSTSATTFVSRVSIRAGSVANTYQLGIKATGALSNSSAIFSSTDLPVGTTVLVVVSYQLVAGSNNDVCKLWINPDLSSAEPATALSQISGSDNNDTGKFFFKQNGITTPNASVDGLRIGESWASLTGTYLSPAPVDFNGDGRSDFSIFRDTGVNHQFWNQYNGVSGGFVVSWGLSTDAVTPGDFDGDGKKDIAVWRGADDSSSGFYMILSSTNTFRYVQFGLQADDPYMIADYDGDGMDDVAIYRPGVAADPNAMPPVLEGQSTFWWMTSNSASPIANHPVPVTWGSGPEDGSHDFPVPGDFNGDGKADFCIYRPNPANPTFALYYVHPGSGGADAIAADFNIYFGLYLDQVVPGDYDGDGTTDIAVVRTEGPNLVWYIRPSSGGAIIRQAWGLQTTQFNPDYPVQGDYDGDGKTDIAVWRDVSYTDEFGNPNPETTPGDHTFYILGSQNGIFYQKFGQGGDQPTALDIH